MANVEIMNAASTTNSPYASSSQQTSPGMPFTPEGLRKWRYMENIIHEALVNSPESSVNSPEAPAPVDREITYYQEIASNQAATNPMNAKYHLSPQDLRELDIVKNAFACMDEMIDVNSKEAATLKKKDHDPTDIMNIMDISMKRFVKMAKRLPAFLQMAQESKLALLRCEFFLYNFVPLELLSPPPLLFLLLPFFLSFLPSFSSPPPPLLFSLLLLFLSSFSPSFSSSSPPTLVKEPSFDPKKFKPKFFSFHD